MSPKTIEATEFENESKYRSGRGIGLKIWNELSDDLESLTSVQTFKDA